MNVNVTPGKMKGLFIVICCLLCLGARGQGIVFDEGTFEEALAKAKKEGKMVFVDCYTSWCGPCKRMAQQVFPMAEVGEAMNGRFVCLMRDMEKGEGVELAKRYRVASYPTFLILNADGSLQHKFVGATGPKTFLARVEEAMDPEKAMGPLEKQYEAGERDKEMLSRYAEMLKAACEGRIDFVADTAVYAERAEKMKRIFLDNGFRIVYDMDATRKVGDGFFFTLGYGNMTGGELLKELLYYGVSCISLSTTGSRQDGIRACTSRMREDLYPVLRQRMEWFRQDHPTED